MKTVLGLSVTSRGIAWALVEGDGLASELTLLDDDVFEVDAADDVTARAASAARSAQAIAAASGHNVAAIGVAAGLVSDTGEDLLGRLLDLLAAAGFADVRVVLEQFAAAGPDDDGVTAQVRSARTAASAVATNAVARTIRPSVFRAPAPRKHIAVRAMAATAAAIATGLLTVSSQFAESVWMSADDGADITAAAQPQLVTVVTPRDVTRSVTASPAEPDASVQVAERSQRAPTSESISVIETAAPQVIPAFQDAVQVPAAPIQEPVAVGVPHLPAAEAHHASAVEPQVLPAAEPHIAVDPAPGPAMPVARPNPAQSGDVWFLGATP